MVDRVQARGMPLDRNEVKLRNRLENVCERLNRPTEFKARLNELIALQRMHVRRDVTRCGRAGCATPRGGALRVAARSRGCAHKPPTAVYTAPVPRVAYRVSGGALARPSRAATCEPCWMCVVADPRLPPPPSRCRSRAFHAPRLTVAPCVAACSHRLLLLQRLKAQRLGLAHLTRIVRRDARDIGIMLRPHKALDMASAAEAMRQQRSARAAASSRSSLW